MQIFILLFIGTIVWGNVHALIDGHPMVRTKLGSVKGSVLTTALEKPIYAFRGIRYAKAPVNELRFKPPVPVEGWEDIYDATEYGSPCPQPEYAGIKTSEDCLFLNVFTTKLPDKKHHVRRPVIVYFHPGGFYSGSAEWAEPEYFMDHDIVLVPINYRLGSLGFISTGDQLAPGNNGLKDQVIALRWVKANIAEFGGDPNLVTIAGYSAGGSSVSLHMVSPMSKGLFHRAIMMSGSSFGNWPVPEEQFNLAQKQARFVGCPDDTSANIINCLKTKTAKELGETLEKFNEFAYNPIIVWYPVIERDFGQERFLTDNPAKLVQCGKFEQVPVMVTVTTDEFSMCAPDVLENDAWVQEINEDFEKVAPIAFIYERDTENSKHISRELKKFYFGKELINNHTISGLEKLFADGVIGFTAHRSAELLASKNSKDVFFYRFDYHGRYSHNYRPGTTTPYGVVHHDDLIYLFYKGFLTPKFNETAPEYKIVAKLTTLLANFAKTGNPTPERIPVLDNVQWKPYTVQKKEYLDITDTLSMNQYLFKERYELWDKLFPIPKCQ